MEATRDRHHGQDLEVGYVDIGAVEHPARRPAAHHAPPPAWLTNWEDRRPRLMTEMFAEMLGVYIYCLFGVGATAALFTTTVEKVANFGSLLTIGLAYSIGIILAIIIAGPASGGHLNPCFTIAFWLFKGFPLRKVPFYIIAQIVGGFLGILSVYGMYHQQLSLITEEFRAVPQLAATIYTPSGPAGVLALFTNPGQDLRYVFCTEFICSLIIAIAVFSVLDAANLFISFASAPFIIGICYAVVIWCYAPESVALNTARDIGGRIACSAAGYGSGCWPMKYSAISALTNILATICGASIQVLLLSDSARGIVNMPNPNAPSLRAVSRGADNTSMRVISNEQNGKGGVIPPLHKQM